MADMWDNEKLKAFVKNTLGCECPDKVFEKIDASDYQIEALVMAAIRIVVGDTLLIYIIHPESVSGLIDRVEMIGAAGKTDRDTNNYNRFRLVVSCVEGVVQEDKVAECFLKAFNDKKMHIHFVSKDLLAGLI